MAFEDFRRQVFPFTAADGLEEVGRMTLGPTFKRADQIALQIEQRSARDDAFGAEEDPTSFVMGMERLGLESARFRDDGLLAETEDADLGVGRLSGVAVAETPAETNDRAPEPRHAEAPAADVEGVN